MCVHSINYLLNIYSIIIIIILCVHMIVFPSQLHSIITRLSAIIILGCVYIIINILVFKITIIIMIYSGTSLE